MTNRRGFLSGALAAAVIPPLIEGSRETVAQAPVSVITPESFGAVGDGTADDTRALQSAIDAAGAQARPLVLRGVTYRVTAPLTARRAVRIRGEFGATILKDHAGRGLDIAPAPAARGRVGSATADQVSVGGATWPAGGVVGAWIEIGTGDDAQRRLITRQSGDTLTLSDALATVPAAGSPVSVMVPLGFLELANLVVNSAPRRGGTSNVWIAFADGVRIADVSAAGSAVDGLKIAMARGVAVTGGAFQRNGAFGVLLYHCEDAVVGGVRCADNRGDYNLEIKDCRNTVVMGCVTSGGERGVALYASGVNPANNCQIIGCVARGGSFAGFQATSQTNEGSAYGADGYAIRGCSAWGHQTGFVVGEGGSQRMTVTVDGCTSVAARGVGFNINARFTHVRGCRAERSGDSGYRVQKDACLLDGCTSVDDQYRTGTAGPAVDIRGGVQQTTVRNLLVQRTTREARVSQALAEAAGADQTVVENLRVLDSEGSLLEVPALSGRRSRGPVTPP